MNEIWNKIKGYFSTGLICFIVGAVGVFIPFFIYSGGRLDHLEQLNQAIRNQFQQSQSENKRLREQLAESNELIIQLKSAVTDLTNEITRSSENTRELDGIISESIGIIKRIRQIFKKYETADVKE